MTIKVKLLSTSNYETAKSFKAIFPSKPGSGVSYLGRFKK